MEWQGVRTLVTGGASFIGSSLVDALVRRGAFVRVVDNLTSGKVENLKHHLDGDRIEFFRADLREPDLAQKAVEDINVVFHLAAAHGGRGFVDLHQVDCSTNFMLDSVIFRACHQAGVGKVVFASSGCVYPNHLQADPGSILYLTEDVVVPPYDADNLYGWAKLMGELTLKAYFEETGMQSASCRYFTVYGPRGVENHAIIAMIAKAFIRQDPFEIWGNGEQIRNWTYVDDIVEGTVRAAERISDATPINLGTMERVRVIDAASEVLNYTGHTANIVTLPDMPTGPLNRVADNSLAKKLLDWEPQTLFTEGLHKTIDWYFSDRDASEVKPNLRKMLLER